MNSAALEERIRQRGRELGFLRLAFSRAGRAPRAEAFQRWLERGYAGTMTYMASHPASRADVTIRSPWARTIISVSLPYAPAGPDAEREEGSGIVGRVSRYARGRDYHAVLRERLGLLGTFVRAESGGRAEARVLVDTSAILERDHAASAGIGWTGKNAMVIDRSEGSYQFLGELLTDLDLTPGAEPEDLCGSCTRCLDACPTRAIVEPRVVDARRCVSYLTIEHRGPIAHELRSAIGEHLFGCDVCQDVCPWNGAARSAPPPDFAPDPRLEAMTLADCVRLDDAGFASGFRASAMGRSKREGLVRNALIVGSNSGDERVRAAAKPLLDDPSPTVREAAAWTLARGSHSDRAATEGALAREPEPEIRGLMRRSLDGAA